jgi:hypothetical protein
MNSAEKHHLDPAIHRVRLDKLTILKSRKPNLMRSNEDLRNRSS